MIRNASAVLVCTCHLAKVNKQEHNKCINLKSLNICVLKSYIIIITIILIAMVYIDKEASRVIVLSLCVGTTKLKHVQIIIVNS